MQQRLLAFGLLCAALVAPSPRARADEDAVQFFHNINVSPDEPVGDAVCFFCNVNLHGKASGDLVVFFGSTRIDGAVKGDVVTFFGNVSAAGYSSIGGDLVNFFGSVRLGDNASIGGDQVAIFGVVHAAASASVRGDRVTLSPWIIFGPLLVIFLIVFVIVHEVRTRRQRQFLQNYPLRPAP